jgi:hypothetical protein
MPNDPRPELPAAPDLTIDEVKELARRAAIETQEERARSHELIRKTHALLKQVDEILARR